MVPKRLEWLRIKNPGLQHTPDTQDFQDESGYFLIYDNLRMTHILRIKNKIQDDSGKFSFLKANLYPMFNENLIFIYFEKSKKKFKKRKKSQVVINWL